MLPLCILIRKLFWIQLFTFIATLSGQPNVAIDLSARVQKGIISDASDGLVGDPVNDFV